MTAGRAVRSPTALVERFDLSAVPATRTDFPALDTVGVRIARGLGAAFAQIGGGIQMTCGEIRTTTLRDWKAGLPAQVAVARYRDRAIKGGLLLSVPPSLIIALVDAYYGGDGAVEPLRAAFGAAEHRLFDRVAAAAGEAIGAGWAEVAPLVPALTGSVFAAADISFGKLDDLVVVQQFNVSGSEVPVAIVYPLAALRGVAGPDMCSAGASAENASELDTVWQRRLTDAVMQSCLPVRTVIARPIVPLARLMSLAPGDFIPVTLPARVPLTVAGRLLAHGTIGEANGRAAIMIDKIEPGALDD